MSITWAGCVDAGLVFHESIFSFHGTSFGDMGVGIGALCFRVGIAIGVRGVVLCGSYLCLVEKGSYPLFVFSRWEGGAGARRKGLHRNEVLRRENCMQAD